MYKPRTNLVLNYYTNKNWLQNLKVQSCKLYKDKCMVAPTQITNTQIFSFLAVLDFKLLSRKVVYKQKRRKKLLKSRLFFKKLASFTGKLLQNNK